MHDTALIIFYEDRQVNKLHVIESEAQQILARGEMRDGKPEKSVRISSGLSSSPFEGIICDNGEYGVRFRAAPFR